MIVSFCFDSDSEFHLVNDAGSVYILDMWEFYQGYWEYPEGQILEITGDEWAVYEDYNFNLIASGPMDYQDDAAWLMNDDGSSGGGKISFNEERRLVESGRVLTYLGLYVENAPQG